MKTPNFGKLFMLILLVMLVSGSANAAPGPAAGKPQPGSKPAPGDIPSWPVFGTYKAIKMASATLGWIVGDGGLILQYRDGIWHSYLSPTQNDLKGVDATPTEAWAVGNGSTIMRNTGTGWQLLASPIPTATNFVDVDIVAAGEVWVLGNPNIMLHYVNGNWTIATTPPSVGPMSWGSPTDGWMVDGSYLYHFSNAEWSRTLPGCGFLCYISGSPISVSMFNVTEGWAGIDSTGWQGNPYAALAHYTVDWAYVEGRMQPCPAGAGCQVEPIANPQCSYVYVSSPSVLAFADDVASSRIYYSSNCEGSEGTYVYYSLSIHSGGGVTVADVIGAISGVSTTDLWMFDIRDHIHHWDGTNISTVPVCSSNYNDVPPAHFAYAAVTYLSCHGIVAGTGANNFSPAANATRIQFAKMITLARGWPLTTPVTPTFSDVPTSHPLYPYVEAAYANGAISGATQAQCQARNQAYPCFFPDDNVTRAQTAVITKRAFGWADDTTGGPHFSDVDQNFYAYAAIETCYNHNIINGVGGGQFAPNADVTRAQLAVILARTLIRGQ